MAAFSKDWRGDRIEFAKDATVAKRVSSYNGGIVYSQDPLELNEVFQIQIDAMEMGWAGSLKFGVTVRSPIDHAVPKGILELYNRPDFWVLSGDKLHHNHEEKVYTGPSLESLTRGDTVGLYVNTDGELHFMVKGKDQGVAVDDIPIHKDIYVVADIYGQVKQISINSTSPLGTRDTVMTEQKRSRSAPAIPLALAAAKALRETAHSPEPQLGASEGLHVSATASSWQLYVQQQASLQQQLCERAPELARLHKQHLLVSFGSPQGQDASSELSGLGLEEIAHLIRDYVEKRHTSGDDDAGSHEDTKETEDEPETTG